MKKRMLAAFLSVSMLISMSVFIPAYAADTESQTESAETTPAATTEPTVTPEATTEPTSSPETTAPAVVGCSECGQTEGHAESCSQYIAPEPTGCAECGQLEGHAESCSQYVAPDPVGCTECGKVDGHEESCSQYVVPAEEACAECGQTGGHLETCSQYAAPAPDVSGMTAEEIFAHWEEYSVEEQQQILDYLAANDETKCAELLALIDDANTLEEETVSLTISAAIADGSDPDQDMIFTISRDDGFSVKVAILAEDFVNGSASITVLLPAGAYTVTADNWSWRYTTEKVENADGSVSFTYTRSKAKWFDADFSKSICYVPAAGLNDDEE